MKKILKKSKNILKNYFVFVGSCQTQTFFCSVVVFIDRSVIKC